jgi:hypothetical protein
MAASLTGSLSRSIYCLGVGVADMGDEGHEAGQEEEK